MNENCTAIFFHVCNVVTQAIYVSHQLIPSHSKSHFIETISKQMPSVRQTRFASQHCPLLLLYQEHKAADRLCPLCHARDHIQMKTTTK